MASVYVHVEFFSLSHVTVLLLLLLFLAGNGNGHHDDCPDSFDCGSLGMNIRYPFTKPERFHCGALAIHGCDDLNKTSVKSVQLTNGGRLFPVTNVDTHWSGSGITFPIIDQDFSKLLQRQNACEAFSYNNNITLPPPSPFGYVYMKENITVFKCNRTHKLVMNQLPNNVFENSSCPHCDFYFGPPIPDDESRRPSVSCSVFNLPVIEGFALSGNPLPYLTGEITVQFQSSDFCHQCHRSGNGHCRRADNNGNVYCAASTRKDRTIILAWRLGLALGVTVIPLLVIVGLFYTRWKKNNPTNLLIEVFLKRHGYLQTKRYSYSEIKKMTNSFRNKLGQGGFGCVYKGQLQDGCYVAVKVLNELKDNGEEFINEVASIYRTSHVNIVTFLGFCLEGSKQALVYEFMHNGSLEKFIIEENDQIANLQLDCQTLYDIAVGVARGLEYLHKGCNTRILHFDIKPHNILLDENFNPKISDFGLAKICTRKESVVSIFGARGTPGYIAPEVFSRNFGAVSHKSDVYSYGMMVLEMVGRRKNINVEAERSSEFYFPHWIYDRLESNQGLGLRNIRNQIDDEKVRKMTIVGLWCIQTNPSTRPAISKVVEMLEGRVELLQMPPKPFLSSPSASPVHFSSETLDSIRVLDAEHSGYSE